jgi:DNA-binding SARP family transcriptional activator
MASVGGTRVSATASPGPRVGVETAPPIGVRLLGGFHLLKEGAPFPFKPGGKAQALIGNLALRPSQGLGRDELLALLWPSSSSGLASQSLSTLVCFVHRALGGAIGGRQPIVRDDGRYRLNVEHGVVVDVAEFDAAMGVAESLIRARRAEEARPWYERAAGLYKGDLSFGSDILHVIERERLRGRYLHARAMLADHQFARGDYAGALVNALLILACDPCREDAHRMSMRCYVRLGQRAQALRQYRICREILEREFEAPPEGATDILYDLVRLEPSKV